MKKNLIIISIMALSMMNLVGCQNAQETSVMNEIGAVETEITSKENKTEETKTENEITEADTTTESTTVNEEVTTELPTEETTQLVEVLTQLETENVTSHVHSYTSKTTKEPSCTENGIITYTCACGNSYTEEKTKTGHTSSDWIVTVAATCTSDGSKHKVCTTCNNELAVEKIASTGTHSYYWDGNDSTRTHKCKGCNYVGITEYNYNGYWGYFDEEMADKFLKMINETRQAAGTYGEIDENNVVTEKTFESYYKTDELISFAKQRAIEAITDDSIIENQENKNEWIAKGYSTIYEMEHYWGRKASGHRSHITLRTSEHTIGIACFMYDLDNTGTNLILICAIET